MECFSLSDETVTWWTTVTRAAECKWSARCHARRHQVTPTSLILWDHLNEDRVFWLSMRAVLSQMNVSSIMGLCEKVDSTL